MVPVRHCDHLIWEEGTSYFAFLWFAACVLSVRVCLLFLTVSVVDFFLWLWLYLNICYSSFVCLHQNKSVLCFNIGIKHGFSCINIRQVPWEVLKTEAEGRGFQHLPRDLANVNALKIHVRSLLLHKNWKHLLHFALFLALFCFAFSPMSRERNFHCWCV